MGLDLSLLPFEWDEQKETVYCFTVIELIRCSNLFKEVRALKTRSVPKEFITLVSGELDDKDFCDGNTQTDANDNPLACVRVQDLVKFKKHPCVKDCFENRAAWAYLGQLPENMWVALYWW